MMIWRLSSCDVSLLTLCIAAAMSSRASAHDLWLVADTTASTGKTTIVRANSGMDFPNSVHAPDPAAFLRRLAVDPSGNEIAVVAAGQEEKSGLLRFQPIAPGMHIVAVETMPKLITLDAEKFNEYLVADGLPHIYRLRAQEKSLDQPGRERYSKFPKTLLQVGDAAVGDPSRVVGLTLEIVPIGNPTSLKIGDTLRVRVLFRSKPLADANLGWDHPGDGEPPGGTVRTDTNGEALVPVARSGLMAIRLTHMTRPRAKDFEWESFWATLTFRVP